MKVAHVILGRSWLYDRGVHCYGRENTYNFMFKNQKVVIKPMTIAEMGKYRVQRSTKVPKTKKNSLYILTKKRFHQLNQNLNEGFHAFNSPGLCFPKPGGS